MIPSLIATDDQPMLADWLDRTTHKTTVAVAPCRPQSTGAVVAGTYQHAKNCRTRGMAELLSAWPLR